MRRRLLKAAIIARHIWANSRKRRRFRRGNVGGTSGSTHSALSVSRSLDYIQLVFGDYLRHAGISREDLRDKRILEVGPGDNLGVALMFVACGAASVVALDKFYAERDTVRQREIYLALRQQLDERSRRLFDEAITLDRDIETNPDRLRYMYGHGIEETSAALGAGSFDVIVSRAALQEIHDIDAAFANMDQALAPGGVALHKIDLRDYGMFTAWGMHPLTFLTVPGFLYRRMTADSGMPNRRLIDYYERKLDELGYDARMFVTHIVGEHEDTDPHHESLWPDVEFTDGTSALIRQIRPQLLRRFKALSDEQLMVDGIFLVARKPARHDADEGRRALRGDHTEGSGVKRPQGLAAAASACSDGDDAAIGRPG